MYLIAFSAFILGVGMILIFTSSLSKIEELKNAEVQLQKIQTEILMLRRNENDFLMRKDLKYQNRFSKSYQSLIQNITNLESFLKQEGANVKDIQSLRQYLETYNTSFSQLVAAYQKVGLDPKSGLQGSLRNAVHNIESKLKTYNQSQLTADMLMLRRREKDFLLRMDIKYLDKFNKDIISFNKTLSDSELAITDKDIITDLLKKYQTDFENMVNGYVALGLDSNSGLQEKMRHAVHNTDESLKEINKGIATLLANNIQAKKWLAIILAIVLSSILIIMSLMTARSISRAIKELSEIIMTVGKTNDFNLRCNYDKKDEILDVSNAFNHMLENFQNAINEANTTLYEISQGHFDKRIKANLVGDLNQLKVGVNSSAESVEFMMMELSNVMQALGSGQFNVKMNKDVPKTFREGIETVLDNMHHSIEEINQVMSNMSQGEFHHRIESEAQGDMAIMKNNINTSMESLDQAIQDILNVVVAQSKGDLTQNITGTYSGQLETLKEAVNTTANTLINTVKQASEVSKTVNLAATEVAQGSSELSSRVQQQAAAIEETSSTMEEMSSTVKNNSEHAKQASELAHEVNDKSSAGSQVMDQTIHAMNSIQESSHKISDIVSMIDSIAFQTNLLALNAAVEAARAGEHGRGFAVVAGEVRNLAQKSADAAKEITNLIGESVNRIDQGTKLASESGSVLSNINQSINEVAEMIEQIAQASFQQNEGIQQVHKAIDQIDQVTQQNAALVEETTSAAESMLEQTDALENEMAFFQTTKATK